MAQKYEKCILHPILLPTIVGTVESKNVIKDDMHYQKTQEFFKKINVAILGIGSIMGDIPDSALYRNGYITEQELRLLQSEGAVGVVLSNFIDANGNPVKSSITDRIISMTLNEVKKVPHSILVANGQNKVIPVLAALKAKYINVLITDSDTARSILKAAQKL
ncbi:MAG: sugar-binding domain-containing protein, partial [Lachnospiraceae bacterium]